MGLFDYVRSSYDLGKHFTNTRCQTKDIEEGIGGTMTHFWIDPKGVLWYPDYRGTSTFEIIEKDDPRYNPKHQFLNYEWISTGQRGKYQVHPITKYIEIYPEQWDGDWAEWPRLRIHFKYGRLMDHEDITGR
jgi:hypothetical protein